MLHTFHESKIIRNRLFIPFLALFLFLMAALPVTAAAEESEAADNVTIVVNGTKAKLSNPARVLNARIYLPVSSVTTLLGAQTNWDTDNEAVTIQSAYGDKIVLSNGVPVVYFNDKRYLMDAAPFVSEGRVYIPFRILAEMLHATVTWDAGTQTAKIEKVEPAIVTEQYGLTEIGQQYGASKAVLLKRNGLDAADEIKAGTALRVVIPSVLENEAEPYTKEDYMLLAKLTQVESGYESYAGQLAVANVVLNRVKDPRFPKTIRDVIYSGKQFPVAHNGLLDKSVPNASVLRAAKDALNGKNNVKDAVYFYDPTVSKGSFWSSLDTVATFGSHRFAK